jgi:hypothetical protein
VAAPRPRDDVRVEPWERGDADDAALIVGVRFDINARLMEIDENVAASSRFRRRGR